MPSSSVTESNSADTSAVTGSVAVSGAAFEVHGVARAGSSDTGVGQAFAGTYGTLTINADGSYSYVLDNHDPDTNVLGTGMTAVDRFTYTYSLNGITSVAELDVTVNGVDEPGQVVSNMDSEIRAPVVEVGALERLVSRGTYTVLLDDSPGGPPMSLTNDGAIIVRNDSSEAIAAGFWDYYGGSVPIINDGLIEAQGNGQSMAVQNSAPGPMVNNGVIRAIATGTLSSSYAIRVSTQGISNAGTIEAIGGRRRCCRDHQQHQRRSS